MDLGFLRELVNTVTGPFGVRLFKGGTLYDQGAREQREQLERILAELGGLGRELLGIGQPSVPEGNVRQPKKALMPGLHGMGPFLSPSQRKQLGAAMKQAREGGASSESLTDNATPNMTPAVADYLSALERIVALQNARRLTPQESSLLSLQTNRLSAAAQRAMEIARQAAAQRGITNGPLIDDAVQRIGADLMRTMSEAAVNARQQELANAYNLMSAMGQRLQTGSSLLSGNIAPTQFLYQDAQQRANEGVNAFMTALGFFAGGLPGAIGGKIFGGRGATLGYPTGPYYVPTPNGPFYLPTPPFNPSGGQYVWPTYRGPWVQPYTLKLGK